jgi:2-amino-4-hydroxy-6-hydroxymethyldihydropteridine diphosphokinase
MPGKNTESLPVGLALGSNLGDRLVHLRAARDFLAALHEGDQAPLVSSVYETDPVDCPPGSPSFLNAVLEIMTSLDPEELLVRAGAFERRLGRAAMRERNSPRPVDIDLLYAGDRCIGTARLVLPHPRLTQRRFVLQPLAEFRPDLVLPGQSQRVADLLEALPQQPVVRIVAGAW